MCCPWGKQDRASKNQVDKFLSIIIIKCLAGAITGKLNYTNQNFYCKNQAFWKTKHALSSKFEFKSGAFSVKKKKAKYNVFAGKTKWSEKMVRRQWQRELDTASYRKRLYSWPQPGLKDRYGRECRLSRETCRPQKQWGQV